MLWPKIFIATASGIRGGALFRTAVLIFVRMQSERLLREAWNCSTGELRIMLSG